MATNDLGAVTAYAAAVAGGYSGTQAAFEASLAGAASKADRAAGPTAGHLAALDESGNPTDSGKALSELAPAYGCGTADLTAGTSPLATGTLYFVYE